MRLTLRVSTSNSHSRTVGAVAVRVGCSVGIDIEWMSEARNYKEILRLIFNISVDEITKNDFYRVWTFHEAYFKTVGKLATPEMAIFLLNNNTYGITVRISNHIINKIYLFSTKFQNDFMLSIVWADKGLARMDGYKPIFLPRT